MRDKPTDITAETWRTAGFIAAAVAAVCYVLLHLDGAAITEDGWAYWQGAVNLAEEGRYTYFSGDPILAWPPLYSLYLAGWTLVFGPSVYALVAANGVLVIVQAWTWTRLSLELSGEGGTQPHRAAILAAALFIGLFVALNGRWVLAHNLLYAVLPVMICAAWKLSREIIVAPVRNAAVFVMSASAALLTHNSAAVFLLASLAAILLLSRGPLVMRVLGPFLLSLLPLAMWAVVRWGLGQTGSHAMGAGRDSWLTYVEQAVHGIGELIAPHRLAPLATIVLVALAVLLIGRPARELARFLLVFMGVAVAVLVALFSVTWVNDPLAGRFVAFVPLLGVPLLLQAAARGHVLLLAALIAAFVPVQAWRVAKWSFDNPHEENPRVFVPIGAEISRTLPPGSTSNDGGRLMIGPSAWQEQLGRTH